MFKLAPFYFSNLAVVIVTVCCIKCSWKTTLIPWYKVDISLHRKNFLNFYFQKVLMLKICSVSRGKWRANGYYPLSYSYRNHLIYCGAVRRLFTKNLIHFANVISSYIVFGMGLSVTLIFHSNFQPTFQPISANVCPISHRNPKLQCLSCRLTPKTPGVGLLQKKFYGPSKLEVVDFRLHLGWGFTDYLGQRAHKMPIMRSGFTARLVL